MSLRLSIPLVSIIFHAEYLSESFMLNQIWLSLSSGSTPACLTSSNGVYLPSLCSVFWNLYIPAISLSVDPPQDPPVCISLTQVSGCSTVLQPPETWCQLFWLDSDAKLEEQLVWTCLSWSWGSRDAIVPLESLQPLTHSLRGKLLSGESPVNWSFRAERKLRAVSESSSEPLKQKFWFYPEHAGISANWRILTLVTKN